MLKRRLTLFSFYCIVLLTTLFVSSCYWQPFPIDSPLTIPWSNNITTFSEALNSTLMPNYSHALPTVMRAVDRCWCDFSTGGFWEPFNVSQWEYLSVQRLRRELEQKDAYAILAANNTQSLVPANDSMGMPLNQTLLPLSNSTVPTSTFWSRLRNFPQGSQRVPTAETREADPPSFVEVKNITSAPQAMSQFNLPFIRQEYDLRPYGIGLVVDLGWSR